MGNMLRPLMAAVALLLLSTPAADAAGWRLERATAIATIVWNHPCADNVKLAWVDLGGGEGPLAQANPDTCEVQISKDEPLAWPFLCTVLLHEYGHLARFRDPLNPKDPVHSHNPESVMFSDPSDPVSGFSFGTGVWRDRHGRKHYIYSGYDRRCAGNGRPFLEARGVDVAPVR